MKKIRYYTDNEILKLKKNVFVIDVLQKREIKYSPVFKLWCIMMKLEFPELTCKDIFERSETMQNNLNNFDKDMQKEKDNIRAL